VYTDQPQAVKTLLRSVDVDAFMQAMQNAGLVDLTDAEVVVEAHVVDADAKDLLTDAETLSAEEAEAAEEFAARRAEDYAAAAANETSADAEEATDATAETTAATTAATTTSSVSSVVMDTAEAATTVEEVQDVAAAAVAAVADAQAAATEAQEALAAAQEALASATTPEEIAAAQAAVEAATATLAEATEALETAQAVAADTAVWAEAAEAHAEAVAHVADLQTQIAIAQAAAADASDPAAQAAAKQLLITLEQALIEAEAAVEATSEAMAEAKQIVIDTYVTAAEPDASSEAAEAMNAWEAAAAELAAADAFVEEVKKQLEEAHRSGDAEAIASLTLQLEKAIEAQATAKVAEEDAKELVDEIAAGVTAAERAAEVAEAEAAVDEAKEELLAAKAAVSDIAAKIAEAKAAGDTALVAQLEEQLKIKQAAVVAAEEAVEAAEKVVVSIQTSHAADIAQSIADEYRATSSEFDQAEHEKTMAKLQSVVEDAADAVEVAKKNMDDLQARIEAIVLAAADPSDPVAQKAAQAQLEALEKKLAAAKATFAAAVAHHNDVKESRDAYETKALAHKAATSDAKDTAESIAQAIAAKVKAERARGPGMAPGMAPGPAGMATHYVKVTDADGTTRYVALETVMQEAQTAVDDLKSQLLKLLERERAAAESGDAEAYAKMKAKVAILKKALAEAESALEDAIKLVASHGYGPAAAPGMAPAFAPSYPDKFIKITDADGTTRYVSAQAAADQALHAYAAANDKVDELKQDLLALLAQMKAAADAGDEAAYNALKEKVASAKSKLRLAEIQAEDALAAYNEAAAQAPGAQPLAPAPSAHDSILASDVAHAKAAVQEIKTELLDLLAQMKRAADSKDKVAYDALKKKVEALKTKLALSERRVKDAEDRLNGVYREEAVQTTPKKKTVRAPPAPRYQGPPATVSVDARHISWYDAPKGAVTGTIFSEKRGTHVEVGEIENVEVYDVVPAEGIYLREGDIKLPAMRDMADEAVSVSVRLQFIRAPDNGACLFHMGNGDGDEFQIKVQDDVLTFQASPSASAGGSSKMAVIAMEEPVSKFITGREYAIVAVLGNDGYMYLYVDGDKVAEGNGMVNPLNGFINEVTMEPRRDNYVGTCYVEDQIPLSAGIIAVDVFDGELNDLDVTMVSGSFTADEDFTTEPEVEI
jgi:hypothetical protein